MQKLIEAIIAHPPQSSVPSGPYKNLTINSYTIFSEDNVVANIGQSGVVNATWLYPVLTETRVEAKVSNLIQEAVQEKLTPKDYINPLDLNPPVIEEKPEVDIKPVTPPDLSDDMPY